MTKQLDYVVIISTLIILAIILGKTLGYLLAVLHGFTQIF